MLVLLLSSLLVLSPTVWSKREISWLAQAKCWSGVRDTAHRCFEYANLHIEHGEEHEGGHRVKRADTNETDTDTYPTMEDWCLTIEWKNATSANNWGNCVNMTTDSTHRYITTNTVPDFYFNSYCPVAIGSGYCLQSEIDAGQCYFEELTCGADNNGPGSNPYGDVWVPMLAKYKIPLVGDPTRQDRPGQMYDADTVGAAKTLGAAQGVAINGIGILGPNDAGDVSIDDAGFQLACGGHVTPPLDNDNYNSTQIAKTPPFYHFHKSPDCLYPFKNASIGVASGATPYLHGKVTGWALDGFKIYTYQDIDGSAPIVDECGGHFGPVDTGEVEYHYHSRVIVPYHMACQGPSLSKCNETETSLNGGGVSFCHPGCGYDVCVQPGTDKEKLEAYLDAFNKTWLESYTVNPYNGGVAVQASLACLLLAALCNLLI